MATEAVGMDAETGRYLTGWDHTVQSIGKLFTTAYFERVMRPHVGSNARRLFGELANLRTAQRFRWACALAIYLHEPRFTPLHIDQVDLDRTGATGWIIDGWYRPRAHLGDMTIAGRRSLTLVQAGRGGIAVTG